MPRLTIDHGCLTLAGAPPLEWRETGAGGPAYYSRNHGFDPSSSAQTLSRLNTVAVSQIEENPDIVDAQTFEERVQRAVSEEKFLVLPVAPRRALAAAAELERRFPLTRFSIDALLLRAMKAVADENEVDWLTVRETDSAGPDGRDWGNLKMLAGMAWPAVEKAIREANGAVLLTDPGLIGRYDLMGRLDVLRGDCGTAKGPRGLILLVPMQPPGMPAIEGKPVPVMRSQWSLIPEAWLANLHRGGRAA